MTRKIIVGFSIVAMSILAIPALAGLFTTYAYTPQGTAALNTCTAVVTFSTQMSCRVTGSKMCSVVLTISPLVLSGGKYHNTQTTTVKDTLGNLMNGVALTMYENAGRSGGYFHGVTGPTKYPSGQAIEHDAYPGPGSYTEWSSATWNGQTVLSLKITVIVP